MEEPSTSREERKPNWQNCDHCPSLLFHNVTEFERHIFEKHSLKEGSIILCQYGQNGMCSALQFGDLRKAGFRYHVREHHSYKKENNSKWTFYSASQNLPAVLNDPNKGKQSNFFTRTWGDGFIDKVDLYPSPHLPEISLAHFESFCKKISKRYQRHCRLKGNALNKNKSQEVENVGQVPSIFYEESFHLNNPDLFKLVFQNLSNLDDPKFVISLQDKLSTYLDIIEIRISEQVAEKSDAFFHAMLSYDTIMDQMAKAVKTVRETRNNMALVKTDLSDEPLKLIGVNRATSNLSNIHELLKLMCTVQQTQPMIQLLLSTSDYVAALDLISSTQKVLVTKLSGIQALRHLSPQLTEMRRLIHKMLTNEFQKCIVSDLNRPLNDESDMPERDTIVSIVSGILRLKEFDFVDTFKVESITSIQATIKQAVIEIVSEREGANEIVLRGTSADHMYLLCNEGIVFLNKVSPKLIMLLSRIISLRDLILETSEMEDVIGNDGEEWSAQDLQVLEMKLKKLIISLTDYCNERCANLIVTKTDKDYLSTDLTLLSRLTDLIDSFCKQCESVTGHTSNALKSALNSFAMKFIQSLHSERRSQINSSLNSERWKAAEVPSELQSIIDKICDNGEIPLIISYERNKTDGKYLLINKESYSVVATVQLLIKILLEYCDATRQSPIIVQYMVNCMIELTRLFNSRCCELVLGARAIQSAGLKTISTSNLALVSRSLQVLLWLVPLIKNLLAKSHFRELSLNGFDGIVNDMRSHKQEIENKICLIVSNMLGSQLSGWEAKPPVPSQTFRNISKHLVKLHEALIDILPLEQIRVIYKRVHENFKVTLREQLIKMNIVANGSPQHGVVTSELTFYLQTLKTLRIISESDAEDNILYDIWLNS